jgi:hypothetical protein
MAKATRKRFIATKPINIDFPNGAKPHDPFFVGSGNVHKRGHIWLTGYADGDLQISFQLIKPRYRFVPNIAGDGEAALFISTDPTGIAYFDPNNGALESPTLSSDDTFLEFIVHKSDANKYFYILNIIDAAGQPFALKDPIIVNR